MENFGFWLRGRNVLGWPILWVIFYYLCINFFLDFSLVNSHGIVRQGVLAPVSYSICLSMHGF